MDYSYGEKISKRVVGGEGCYYIMEDFAQTASQNGFSTQNSNWI